MEFTIGIIIAAIAVMSFLRKEKKNKVFALNSIFKWIAILAAIVGFIGYVFLGWRF